MKNETSYYCPSCGEKKTAAEMVGIECYLCVLSKPYNNFWQEAVYRKAVAVALAFATPLTLREARKVVKKVWNRSALPASRMRTLLDIKDGRFVDIKPEKTFYKRVMEVLR